MRNIVFRTGANAQLAAAEKMASFMTLDYLKAETAKGQRSDFDRYLRSVPDVSAAQGDVIRS